MPVGALSAFPTIVQAGTHPQLTWNVTLPAAVLDVVTITSPGTVTATKSQYVDVRILGASVKAVTTNNSGQVVTSGSVFLNLMVQQVSSPVRWDLCMAAMLDSGITGLIELSPAGTLVGLAKRSMPGVECVAVKTPENIDAALSLINNHR
jgi:malonyl CoA-acyl carrier protein transacylase